MEVDEQGIESKSVLTRFQTDLPPFLKKTYELVANAENNVIISWGDEGESFVVWDSGKFAREELPKHFKHNNFSSFVRQLNTYGFHKCADRWEFRHKHFRRGALDELSRITRRGGSGKASSSSHSMSLPSTPTSPSRHRGSMHKGLLFQGASQAAACSGRTGLDRLGFVAGTMLQADRCSEAHGRSMTYDDLASPGEAQLANSPPQGGCVPDAEWRESEGELREELGRQGEVIRQLMAEVGRLKEQQGIMAMQLLRMGDIQQASKKQRTYHSPPPARRNPEYHEAGGGADPATNQRLGACESGLAKTAENVMTLTSNQEVLYNGMKVMEAHLKAESDSISSRVCNALSHIAAPGTELESALKHFLGGQSGSPKSKKLSDNNPAAKSSPPPPVRQSVGAVQLWNPIDFGRGRQPCREESSVASPTTARMPQS